MPEQPPVTVPVPNFTADLYRELADATALVWKMKHLLSETGQYSPELRELVCALGYRAGVIGGIVVRWELLTLGSGSAPGDGWDLPPAA